MSVKNDSMFPTDEVMAERRATAIVFDEMLKLDRLLSSAVLGRLEVLRVEPPAPLAGVSLPTVHVQTPRNPSALQPSALMALGDGLLTRGYNVVFHAPRTRSEIGRAAWVTRRERMAKVPYMYGRMGRKPKDAPTSPAPPARLSRVVAEAILNLSPAAAKVAIWLMVESGTMSLRDAERATHMSRPTILRALRELESAWVIMVLPEPRHRQGRRYALLETARQAATDGPVVEDAVMDGLSTGDILRGAAGDDLLGPDVLTEDGTL